MNIKKFKLGKEVRHPFHCHRCGHIVFTYTDHDLEIFSSRDIKPIKTSIIRRKYNRRKH
jgi:hypothetical protein